jgi:hypothetical protein
MKNFVVFKRTHEKTVHGAVTKEEWQALQQFAAGTVEKVAEADTWEEASDMVEGYDAIGRVGEICDL